MVTNNETSLVVPNSKRRKIVDAAVKWQKWQIEAKRDGKNEEKERMETRLINQWIGKELIFYSTER